MNKMIEKVINIFEKPVYVIPRKKKEVQKIKKKTPGIYGRKCLCGCHNEYFPAIKGIHPGGFATSCGLCEVNHKNVVYIDC